MKHLKSEAYIQALIDVFPFMVWFKDINSRLLLANKEYAKMVGVDSTDKLKGKTDFDYFPSDLAQQYVQGDQDALNSKQPISGVYPIKDSNGCFYWIESFKVGLSIEKEILGTLGYARNITATLQKESEYYSLIEKFPHSIVRYDKKNKRIFLNTKTAESYDVSHNFLLGKSPSDFPGGESAIEYEKQIQEVFKTGKSKEARFEWLIKEDKKKIFDVFLVAELDANGQIIAVISMGKDVTEALEDQARIHNLAYFDPLTTLPNRSLLTDRINQAKTDSKRQGHLFGLMILDLDRFKEINDTYGHTIGDALLCGVARRLETCIRENDTIARMGGDEFAILLTDLRDPESASRVALKILQSFDQPFHIIINELFITPSIGIATYPSDSEDIEDLLKFADSALYLAKRKGRNNFQFYSAELSEKSIERMSIESSLRKAIQQNEFLLHFQPQVNLKTREIVGLEALIRWQPINGVMIYPDKFIGIAEDCGLIIEVGKWVITAACKAATHWNQHRSDPIPVSINLSTRQFIQNDLEESIKQIMQFTGCKPEWIKLEITESLLLENNDNIQKLLMALHNFGLAISMDDFGTGYSSLSYMNQFPISQLKIDRSFVKDITTDLDRGLLVKAIISMAKSLRKSLVAEGVETEEQARFLAKSGCEIAQGYLFSKPLPLESIILK